MYFPETGLERLTIVTLQMDKKNFQKPKASNHTLQRREIPAY